ncbi:MAG: hypothetical protein QOJ05_253 [Verrucomicrobiota bacterium]
METYIFAAGIGLVAGLRTFLAPAAIVWAVRVGWLNLHDSPFAFMESNLALVGLSIGALGELVADLVPSIPRRTAVAPLLARLLSGAFCGACLGASANRSVAAGAVCGGICAVIGAFAGYEIRRRLVTKLRVKDFVIALSEDFVAFSLALLFVSR